VSTNVVAFVFVWVVGVTPRANPIFNECVDVFEIPLSFGVGGVGGVNVARTRFQFVGGVGGANPATATVEVSAGALAAVVATVGVVGRHTYGYRP
jgi:hypothetical protein